MPSDLIPVRRIEDTPKIKEYTLTLKFPLKSEEDLDCDKLAEMLQHGLRDWIDGRYPFDAEMLSAGLGSCLKRALLNVFEAGAQDEFGNELITFRDGDTAMWYLKAAERFSAMKKPWIRPEPEVEIT